MNIWQSIVEAMQSLSANKMRAGLTILGIVIGVAAVIAMLAIGQGAQNTISNQIGEIGTNLLFVFSGNMRVEVRNPKALTLQDAAVIADPFMAPSVVGVAPVIQGRGTVTNGGEETTTTLMGATAEYFSVRSYGLTEGEPISADHLLQRASVALIGVDVADKLFDRRDGLVDQTIRIQGQPFRIIGVLESKGGSAFGSEDDQVIIPLTTAQIRILRRPQRDGVDMIFAQVADSSLITQATDEISQILRDRHGITSDIDDFTVMSQQDIVTTAQSITGILTLFLGGVAAISLLVGGIGIMNIMLVSVTERTREIGLRKALGARKRDILIQFLTESALLSLFGGLIGIFFGWLIAFVVGQIAAASNTPLEPAIGLNAILLATLFSTAVGLFFGIYPANRAASLQPVEALRYE